VSASDQSDTAWTRWIFETCLMFGCDPATAARVAALFCDAIRKEAHA
jgi:hypothetical protein